MRHPQTAPKLIWVLPTAFMALIADLIVAFFGVSRVTSAGQYLFGPFALLRFES